MSAMPEQIVVFILDAVRADHLGCYGYQRATSPNIDVLSKKSTRYDWAFAPSTYTLASVPSIIAGKPALEMSNRFTGRKLHSTDFQTLKEFKRAGYLTAMFTANIVTSHYYIDLYKQFDYFWDDLGQAEKNRGTVLFEKSEVVMDHVVDFFKTHSDQKKIVFIHLMDAHGPYVTDEDSPFVGDHMYQADTRKISRVVPDSMVGVTKQNVQRSLIAPNYQLQNVDSGKVAQERFTPDVKEYVAKYDYGILKMDQAVGRLIETLKTTQQFDQTQLVVTSDHGETMGEDNILFIHGSYTHPVLARVPLIIKHASDSQAELTEEIQKEPYSLVNLMKDVYSQAETVEEQVVIHHAKSVAVMVDGTYHMIHVGDFNNPARFKENLFSTREYSFVDQLTCLAELDATDLCYEAWQRYGTGFRKTKVDASNAFQVVLPLLYKNYQQVKLDHESLQNNQQKQSGDGSEGFVSDELSALIEKTIELSTQNTQINQRIAALENHNKALLQSPWFRAWRLYHRLKQ